MKDKILNLIKERNGKIKQVEIDRLYYCISLNRRIPYVEYLDIMDLISSGKYRKQIVEDMFNVFYIK